MRSSIAHGLGAAAVCGAVFAIWACAGGVNDDGATTLVDPDAGPETSASQGSCGQQGTPCCADGGCSGISYCGKKQVCESHPTDVGQPCTQGSQCTSGTCSTVQETNGGSGVCTEPCLSASDCVTGWRCDHAGPSGSPGRGVCACTPVAEVCNGKDDNCDGTIDDEPGADVACTLAAGVPQKCVGGACICVAACGDAGVCTDLTHDSNNCGACGHACLPVLQACASSECLCAGLLCPLPAAGDAGYLVADGGADGGPVECVQSTSDPNNCGACGVVCASPYSCQNGTCQARELVQGATTDTLHAVVSDGTNAYIVVSGSSGGTLLECAVTGCNQKPTTVASGLANTNNNGPGMLALGGSWVYWANTTAVEDLATANAAATTFAQPTGSSIYAVATSSTHVFWSDMKLGISMCALGSTCASPTVLVDLASMSGPPQIIAADETYVYWTDQIGNLFSRPVAGGTPSTLATDANTYGPMVAVAGRVYYLSSQNGGIRTAIGRTPSSGATYFAIGGAALATDGTTLYWADNHVVKCPLGPSCAAPTVLASANTATWVAVDATHTYWIATDGNGNSGVYEYAK